MDRENAGVEHTPTLTPGRKIPPNAICRAMVIAQQLVEKKLRGPLAAILAHANRQNPFRPIGVYLETLAEIADCSVRTMSRHIPELVNLGFITVDAQRRIGIVGRFNSGKYACRTFYLTEYAIAAFGLIDSPIASTDDNTDHGTTAASDATPLPSRTNALSTPADGAVINKPEANLACGHTGTTHINKQDQQEDLRKKIPTDLAELAARELEPGEIFFLMGLATRQAKRLSDAWTVVKPYADKLVLTGDRLKYYLIKTINHTKNLAEKAQRAIEKNTAIKEFNFREELMAQHRKQIAGKVYRSPDGRNWLKFSKDGKTAFEYLGYQIESWPLITLHDINPFLEKLRRGDWEDVTAQRLDIPVEEAKKGMSETVKAEWKKLVSAQRQQHPAAGAASPFAPKLAC